MIRRFPFAELKAPANVAAAAGTDKVPMSILQVAVASFLEGKRIPPSVLKMALVPGMFCIGFPVMLAVMF